MQAKFKSVLRLCSNNLNKKKSCMNLMKYFVLKLINVFLIHPNCQQTTFTYFKYNILLIFSYLYHRSPNFEEHIISEKIFQK